MLSAQYKAETIFFKWKTVDNGWKGWASVTETVEQYTINLATLEASNITKANMLTER